MTIPTQPSVIHDPASMAIAPSAWGDAVNDCFDWFMASQPYARVYRNTTFSIPNGAPTAIEFDQELNDGAGMHSTSSNNTRLTVPDTNLYTIGGGASFDSDPTGVRSLAIMVNGSFRVSGPSQGAASTGVHLETVTTLYLTGGTYLELVAYQDSGAALDITVDGIASPYFWCKADH